MEITTHFSNASIRHRFNKHVRVLADYQFRDFKAPDLPDAHVANRNLDEVDDLFGIRVWASF